MRSPRRTLLLLAAVPGAILGVCVIAFCVGSPLYYHEKYAPALAGVRPARLPGAIVPETQHEAHTCGLHSLSAIYTAYGLDPGTLRLRFRLGTDMPASNFLPSSRGTIHPDMLRVLRQDGFDAQILLAGAPDGAQRLSEHLDRGHPAVALTRVSDFHWVVIAGREGEALVICDSLVREPYRRPLGAYLEDEVYSLLLVSPHAD